MSFPIHRVSYRTLDPDWEGEVFIADIDRTYLATHFSSLRGLARIPFERAAEKEDIEGMARLFREIRRGPEEGSRYTPLFFVSASPSQLRPVIEQKMTMDGIGFDGTTFKNWGKVIRRMSFSRLREQIGFKLTALLAGRAMLPTGAIEVLIGDDLETDPVTYAIYADVLAGRIPVSDLARILMLNGVGETDARSIVASRRELRPGRGVRRAFIRMERHADPDWSIEYAPGIIGCTGAFQMALVMWREGSISLAGTVRVAAELVRRGLSIDELTERMVALVRRGLLDEGDVQTLSQELVPPGLVREPGALPEPDPRWVAAWKRGPERLWTPPRFVGE